MANDNKPLPKRMSVDFLEGQVREAEQRGDFDNLPGKGKPLENLSDDPLWWVKDKLKREGASVLPPGLQLKRDRELAFAEIAKMGNETMVRSRLEKLNDHIRATNLSIVTGPPSNVIPVDVETEVERWRRERE